MEYAPYVSGALQNAYQQQVLQPRQLGPNDYLYNYGQDQVNHPVQGGHHFYNGHQNTENWQFRTPQHVLPQFCNYNLVQNYHANNSCSYPSYAAIPSQGQNVGGNAALSTATVQGQSAINAALIAPQSNGEMANSGANTSSRASVNSPSPSTYSNGCHVAPISQPGSRSNFGWLNGAGKDNTRSKTKKTRTDEKYRTVYTESQKYQLEKDYRLSPYIVVQRKLELAAMLGLSERQVKIWFQNRRAKDKRKNRNSRELLNAINNLPLSPHQQMQ